MANIAQKTLQLYYHLNGGEGGGEGDKTDYFFIENAHDGENTLTLTSSKSGGSSADTYSSTVEYSKDKTNWTTITFDTTTPYDISMESGEKVYFRNDSGKFNYYDGDYAKRFVTSFKTNEDCNAGGDLRTILNYKDIDNVVLTDGCFNNLFQSFDKLKTAPKLPATNLSDYCYYNMFNNCTSLTSAPELPATNTLSHCYQSMFSGCTSLTTAPTLPATELATECYRDMFSYCYSLTTAPTTLPATELATECYLSMFSGCSSLTEAPELPATTLAGRCYQYMFSSCTSLSVAPELPATELATECYQSMFYGCSSLTTAPKTLPATTLAQSCYERMFQNCTSLSVAPELPATTLLRSCYSQMFSGCTSLTESPELPATDIHGYCYSNMFSGCTSLTKAPTTLPATSLVMYCYSGMFSGCTSLTKAPTLPATTLSNYCYGNMFSGCTSLNEVTTFANDISATGCVANWLRNVSSNGTFYNNGSATYTTDSESGIPTGWTEVKPEPEVDYFYIENTYNGTNTLTLTSSKSGNPSADLYSSSVEYSTDKENWTSITLTTNRKHNITMNSGEKVYFRNNNGRFNYSEFNWFYTYFKTTEVCSAGGDLRSILNYEDIDNVVLTEGCFYSLFYYSSKLTDISQLKLPSTTLAPYCYSQLFYGCSSLTTVPSDLLPATTLSEGCYSGTFSYCSSLTKIPELPATTLVSNCYSYMCEECSSLTEVTTYANDISAVGCIEGWLYYVGESGTFYNNGSATYTTDSESGIPTGWVEVKQN